MPRYPRRSKPAAKPRRFRKKAPRKKAPLKMRISRFPSVVKNGMLPRHAYSTHSFADSFTLSATATESAAYLQYFSNFVDTRSGTPSGVFSAKSSTPGTNDPYTNIREDPVPRGWDAMSALYNTVRIYASKISIQYINNDATGPGSTICGVYKSDYDNNAALSAPTTMDEVIGTTIPGFKYVTMGPRDQRTSRNLVSTSFSEKYMSRSDRSENEFQIADSFQGNSLTNYYNIVFLTVSNSTSLMNGTAIVKIYYSCKWSDPKSFAADDAP